MWQRLLIIGLGAVAATTATLIDGAHLWVAHPTLSAQTSRPVQPRHNRHVIFGVLSFYAALFTPAACAASILVVPTPFAGTLGHRGGPVLGGAGGGLPRLPVEMEAAHVRGVHRTPH